MKNSSSSIPGASTSSGNSKLSFYREGESYHLVDVIIAIHRQF